MIGWFDVSPEGILRNQFGAQVGLVTELENSTSRSMKLLASLRVTRFAKFESSAVVLRDFNLAPYLRRRERDPPLYDKRTILVFVLLPAVLPKKVLPSCAHLGASRAKKARPQEPTSRMRRAGLKWRE